MTVDKDNITVITTTRASNPVGAIVDARYKSADAVRKYPKFFTPSHMLLVEQVQDLVSNFFPIRKGVYVNHRDNRGKPFSVVKVDNPSFPAVKRSVRDAFFKNLADMNVSHKFAKATNSYLFYVQ